MFSISPLLSYVSNTAKSVYARPPNETHKFLLRIGPKRLQNLVLGIYHAWDVIKGDPDVMPMTSTWRLSTKTPKKASRWCGHHLIRPPHDISMTSSQMSSRMSSPTQMSLFMASQTKWMIKTASTWRPRPAHQVLKIQWDIMPWQWDVITMTSSTQNCRFHGKNQTKTLHFHRPT